MKQANVLLTFDYELFLGKKSGSVQDCLIKPTEIIQASLKKNNAKAIFFIDATYIWRMSELITKFNCVSSDYAEIKKQLKALANDGHYLYLHIHPHWIDAKYNIESNDWNLEDTSRYAFSSLSNSDKDLIFTNSIKALKAILPSQNKIEGYRAGGLFIQPFQDIAPYFKEHSIKYDFSTLPNFYFKSTSHSFNFQGIKETTYYHFNESTMLENIDGTYTEYPLSVNRVGLLQRVFNSICYRFLMNNADKTPFGKGNSARQQIHCSLNTRFTKAETVSIELLNRVKAYYYKRQLKKTGYLHFLSHPKLTNHYSLRIFDKWLTTITNKSNLNTDFKRF